MRGRAASVNPVVGCGPDAHDERMTIDNGDSGSNVSGNQSGDSAETWDAVDSGQSEDLENSLTGQGTSDRITLTDIEQEGDDSLAAPDGSEA